MNRSTIARGNAVTAFENGAHRPLCTPIRRDRLGCPFRARLISRAHSTGSSGLRRKTSAMPSPASSNQSASRIRISESLRPLDDLVQHITQSALLINRVPRVTYDVDEQDVRDLQRHLLLDLGRHVPMRFTHILRCSVEQIKIDNPPSQGCGRDITVVAGVPPAKLRNCSRHGCLYRLTSAQTRRRVFGNADHSGAAGTYGSNRSTQSVVSHICNRRPKNRPDWT